MKNYLRVMRITLFTAILVCCLSACKTYLPQTNTTVIGKIETGLGPEDFVLDTFSGNERLVISCSGRRKTEPQTGNFYAYNFATGNTTILKRINEPENFECYPHGIDLVKEPSGKVMLYAVNHQKNNEDNTIHSVVQYEVKNDSLFFMANHMHASIVSPNDVAALPDGSFYVTNDSKHTKGLGLVMEKLFQTKKSTIVYKNAENKFIVATDKLPYANGVAINGDKVYISCTFKSILNEYKRNADGTLTLNRKMKGAKGLDNITFYNNYLVIPYHTDFMKFIKHVKSSDSKSPGIVSLFNIDNNEITPIFSTYGEEISANSTALIYRDTLYISQVFDGFLLKVVPVNLPK